MMTTVFPCGHMCIVRRLANKQMYLSNMEHTIFKRPLPMLAVVALFSLWYALAQPQPPQPLPPHIWGPASNGVCVGVCVRQSDWPTHKRDFNCDIDLRNTSTNRLYIWVPPLERRYEIELWGPDAQRIRQLKPLISAQTKPWLGREPVSDEWHCLDWCFLKETFDVRTNGLHTLIVSARVNAFTNFAVGRSAMRRKPVYFLLPQVTNTFNILPLGPGN